VGCGLRRQELAKLKIEEIQQRDGRWCVVDILGKGNRVRTIPMPAWAKAANRRVDRGRRLRKRSGSGVCQQRGSHYSSGHERAVDL
jgi:integrase